MKISLALFAVFAVGITVDATVFFKEQFLDGGNVSACLLSFTHFDPPVLGNIITNGI